MRDSDDLRIWPFHTGISIRCGEHTGKLVALLPEEVDGSELPHEAEHVVLHPPFGDFPVLNASKHHTLHLELLARRFKMQKIPLVGSSVCRPQRDGITLGDQFIDGRRVVQKGVKRMSTVLLTPSRPLISPNGV